MQRRFFVSQWVSFAEATPIPAATIAASVAPRATAPGSRRQHLHTRQAARCPEFSKVQLDAAGGEGGSDGGRDHIEDGGKKGVDVYQGRSPWEKKMLAALRTYKKLNGDLFMPKSFAVPTGDERWPLLTWGYRLGAAVIVLRHRLKNNTALSDQMKEELEKLGFVENLTQYKWDSIVLPALQRFHQEYKHTDVPQEFVVPTDDETWPRLARGYRLGCMAKSIRRKKAFSAQAAVSKDELERIDFCYGISIAERDWTEKILPSLQVYRREFGDGIVPTTFVVPASPPWPAKAWRMPLGRTVEDIRQGKCYAEQIARDRPLLDAIGFAWNRNDAVWNEVVIPALATYVDLFKNGWVPQKFVVPSEAPWPERAWGGRLGKILVDLRSKGTYFGQYGRDLYDLDELGVAVSLKLSSRAWKKRVVPLLSLYSELHGEEGVPHDFVIPPDAPWEESSWGVRLGLIVARNPQHGTQNKMVDLM